MTVRSLVSGEFYRKLVFDVMEHVAEDYPPMRIPTWRMARPHPS